MVSAITFGSGPEALKTVLCSCRMSNIVDPAGAHTRLCHFLNIDTGRYRYDMTCAQYPSTFFETNYEEKLASEVVDRSLLTGVGSEVEIAEETICIIRHMLVRLSSVEGGD